MSLSMDCFDLENLVEDEESVNSLLIAAVREGTPVRAYSGLYHNKWFKNLQIIAGSIIRNEEKTISYVSLDTHCAGLSVWKCRVIEEITPEDGSKMDMRLRVEPLLDDENKSRAFTVIDVMNADVLPSYAPGEIIQLQVIAKADQIGIYADEAAYVETEGQKVELPFGENGEKEEKVLSLEEGYAMPSGFMNNHFKKTQEEAMAAKFTDEDKWVYLRGKMLEPRAYIALFEGKKKGEKVDITMWSIPVETYFGTLDIMFNDDWIEKEKRKLVKEGSTVSTVCAIQGDTLIYEYENGMVIDKKNNMMAVRYAFSSGRVKRLLPIMADDCRFYTDAYDMEITGKEDIVKYLVEKYRHITEEEKTKEFTAYAFVNNDDGETEKYGLEHKRGEPCVAIGLNDGNQEGWSQFVFLDYGEDEKITRIHMTDAVNYRFSKAFESWAEMEEAMKRLET